MAAMLRYNISETPNLIKQDVFRTLDEAYHSSLAAESKEFYQMILCAATAHNHILLINLMLTETRSDLLSMVSLPLPRPVHRKMLSTKCHLNDLTLFQQLHRDAEVLETTPRWSSLINLIHSRRGVQEILTEFSNAYGDSSVKDYSFYCRQFLCAVEEPYLSVLTHIFNILDITKYVAFAIIPSPLFVAIDNQNLQLVELFLREGSFMSLTLNCRYRNASRPSSSNPTALIVYAMSAIEHACVLDHLEMLKLMFSYGSTKNNEREIALHYGCLYGSVKCIRYLLGTDVSGTLVNVRDDVLKREYEGTTIYKTITKRGSEVRDELEQVRRTPLHTVMMSPRYSQTGKSNLPTIISRLIYGGACVNSKDSKDLTPLNYLMIEVATMECCNIDISRDDRHALLESTRLLLKAGSNVNKPKRQSPLHCLLTNRGYNWIPEGKFVCFLKHVFSRQQALPLKSDLVCLLLKQGAESMPKNGPSCPLTIVKMARELVIVKNDSKTLNGCSTTVERCNALINVLCEMFRCFLMVGYGRGPKYFSNASLYVTMKFTFRYAFLELSYYSLACAPMLRLLRLLVSTLDASELNKLKRRMNRELQVVIESGATSEEWQIGARNSVQSVCGLGDPRFLKHLVRLEIRRAFTSECLLRLTRFEFPQKLINYILLKD